MMKFINIILSFFFIVTTNSQSINLNEQFINDYLRTSQLLGSFENNFSFTSFPIDVGKNGLKIDKEVINLDEYSQNLFNSKNRNINIKILPINYNIELSSNHPYNRNNGSMIPNRGYQHIISPGFFLELGPLSIQFKPELFYAQNKDFEGFGEGPNGHEPFIWAKRYKLWNKIDMPERFGEKSINEILIGQSSIKLNYKGLSIGVSNENIWWGPSIRNSIMMSNHARGFKHITFNTNKPLTTKIGNFEWQIISGRLESSGFTPPNTEIEHAGTKLYIPKINQRGRTDDWRYLQGYSITYSPKWISGLSLGFIRFY